MNLNFGFEGLLEKGLIDLDFVHVCPGCLAYLPPDVWPMAKLVDLFKREGVFNPFPFK